MRNRTAALVCFKFRSNPSAATSSSFSFSHLYIADTFEFLATSVHIHDEVVRSHRVKSNLTRCWAPGFERSFRSFRIIWESAVVTS